MRQVPGMEFAGELIDSLPMADRFSMCNMAIEAGAKVGIITPDSITEQYVSARETALQILPQ